MRQDVGELGQLPPSYEEATWNRDALGKGSAEMLGTNAVAVSAVRTGVEERNGAEGAHGEEASNASRTIQRNRPRLRLLQQAIRHEIGATLSYDPSHRRLQARLPEVQPWISDAVRIE